jgi:hypothetical protein
MESPLTVWRRGLKLLGRSDWCISVESMAGKQREDCLAALEVGGQDFFCTSVSLGKHGERRTWFLSWGLGDFRGKSREWGALICI